MVEETFTAIEVNGVGYGVIVTLTTRRAMSSLETVEMYTYAHIREDCFDLYGFLNQREKSLFLRLIDVDGVGPKTAIAIMDRGIDAIIAAVREADVAFFSSVPRVGKKSAQKIIIELKSKLGGEELQLNEPVGKSKEVQEALTSLGFSALEAQKVLKTLDVETMRLEDAVKEAIRFLTKL